MMQGQHSQTDSTAAIMASITALSKASYWNVPCLSQNQGLGRR